MSSSQPFVVSSPCSSRSTRRKSRFTYKNLSSLATSSTSCPLRVIAHIDLDAFYAQCEMVRLGVSEDQPLAVQQWQGLIAINYPARAYGISRHANIADAQKACPSIILQHVATWKEGEEKWAYHNDANEHIATHKVSLDPYRLESRKILAVIREILPSSLQKVEKASVDEVFLDLSAQVHSILIERYPEINGPVPYDDPTEKLPAPPTSVLDWNVDALVDLDQGETEDEDPDWDDIAMLIGSEIVRNVRAEIKSRLKYTCSAGLARNKMLAKLGSGYKKPNQQTIIRNRAIQDFLSEFKFTKIRNLGGKLGDEVVSTFNTESVKELREFSMDQLKKLGDDTGTWLYQTIRGEDHSEVNSRTQIKSMLSAKSFPKAINTFEQGVKWLRIFVADIFSRLVEEGVLENKRRPKTINLHHRQGMQTRSKQAPIPQGKSIDEALLFELSKNLLAQVVVDGRAWPCSNLSLSVGGFEDGITGNQGIGGFLVRGEEIKTPAERDSAIPKPEVEGPAQKKQRVDTGKINTFFSTINRPSAQEKPSIADFTDVQSGQPEAMEEGMQEQDDSSTKLMNQNSNRISYGTRKNDETQRNLAEIGNKSHIQSTIPTYFCQRCNKSVLLDQKEEHEDFHFASDLQEQERASQVAQTTHSRSPAPTHRTSAKGRGKPPGGSASRIEKGQSRLEFGH